jgi:hypothetical protein
MWRELREERACQILSSFMSENAKRNVKSGLEGFRIEDNDAWALAGYFKLATGDIIGYKAELIQDSPRKSGIVFILLASCFLSSICHLVSAEDGATLNKRPVSDSKSKDQGLCQ